jgi:hypothetical protein
MRNIVEIIEDSGKKEISGIMKDSRETRKDHGGGSDHVINMCGEKLRIFMQPSKYSVFIWGHNMDTLIKNVGGFPHKMLIIIV